MDIFNQYQWLHAWLSGLNAIWLPSVTLPYWCRLLQSGKRKELSSVYTCSCAHKQRGGSILYSHTYSMNWWQAFMLPPPCSSNMSGQWRKTIQSLRDPCKFLHCQHCMNVHCIVAGTSEESTHTMSQIPQYFTDFIRSMFISLTANPDYNMHVFLRDCVCINYCPPCHDLNVFYIQPLTYNTFLSVGVLTLRAGRKPLVGLRGAS